MATATWHDSAGVMGNETTGELAADSPPVSRAAQGTFINLHPLQDGLLVLVSVVSLLGSILINARFPHAGLGLMIGGVLGFLLRFQRRRNREWILLLPDGFRLGRGSRFQDYLLEEVHSLGGLHSSDYLLGQLHSETRKLVLDLGEPGEPSRRLVLSHTRRMDQHDPLGTLFLELQHRLHSRAETALIRQQPIHGEAWIWGEEELQFPTPTGTLLLPFRQIDTFTTVGQNLCIWQFGQEKPVTEVSLYSQNAWLLEDLLAKHLGIPRLSLSEAPGQNLGRMLCEHRRGRMESSVLWCCSALSGSVTGLLSLLAVQSQSLWLALAAGFVGLFTILAMVFAYLLPRSLFRCHEHGLVQVNVWGSENLLRFEDLVSFRYREEMQKLHGVSLGKLLILECVTKESPGKPYPLQHRCSKGTHEKEFTWLRDQLATVLARRSMQEWRQQESVVWMPQLKFTREGLEYRHRRWLRLAQPELIPFESIREWEVRNNRFYLWTNYQERAVINIASAELNFFSGLVLLDHMLHPISD